MVTKDELLMLGFKNSFIEKCINDKSLEETDEGLNIKSDRLYGTIFKRALMNNLDIAEKLISKDYPLYLFYYYIVSNNVDLIPYIRPAILESDSLYNILCFLLYNEDLEFDVRNIIPFKVDGMQFHYEALYKYVYYRQPELIIDLISDIINKTEDCFELFMIKKSAELIPSNIDYFMNDTGYESLNISKDELTKYERELLLSIETCDYERAKYIIDNISNVYNYSLPFTIISILFNELGKFLKYPKLVSSRVNGTVVGETYSVLFELLKSKDFNRFKSVVDDLIDSNEVFTVPLEIYNVLISRIAILIDRNNEHIIDEITSTFEEKNEKLKVFGKYSLSSISFDTLKKYEELQNGVDISVPYYELYRKNLKNGNYVEARKYLKGHIAKSKKLGVTEKFEYLLAEVDYLISNDNDTNENKELINNHLKNAFMYEQSKDFVSAANSYSEALVHMKRPNTFIYGNIGIVCYEMGNYNEAEKFFKEEIKTYIKPKDYIYYMKTLYRLNRFSEVLIMADAYTGVFGLESGLVYYIKSACYLRSGRYKDASSELSNVEIYNSITYNNFDPLTYEKNIIEKCSRGENCAFDIDDYVELGLNEDEIDIASNIEIDNELQDENFNVLLNNANSYDSLTEKINYLVCLAKMLFNGDHPFEALTVAETIEGVLNNAEESREKDKIKRLIQSYKNNFLVIE